MAGLADQLNQFVQQAPLPAFHNPLLEGLGGGIGGAVPLIQPRSWASRFGVAERRALRLFKDMYGKRKLWHYLNKGYVDFHAKDGRTYRIHRENHLNLQLLEVYQRTKQGKKLLYKLCLVDTEKIPPTDGVLKRLWLLRCDPNSLHEQANIMH